MPLPAMEKSLEVEVKLEDWVCKYYSCLKKLRALCDWQAQIHLYCVLNHHFTREEEEEQESLSEASKRSSYAQRGEGHKGLLSLFDPVWQCIVP